MSREGQGQGREWQMAAELGRKCSTNKLCWPRAGGVLLHSLQSGMTKLLALSHSWEIQRGGGGKCPAEWISHCLEEKFNERSKMLLGEELEREHTGRCFALTGPGCSELPCPQPKQSFTGAARFVLMHSVN